MASASLDGVPKQDLPPKGGYAPIYYKRVLPKSYFNVPLLYIGYIGVSCFGYIWYYFDVQRVQRIIVERRSSVLALRPMLWAEKDRSILVQARKNRDEEEELMKNVPGWVVGQLYNEPIYRTTSRQYWRDINLVELYAHAPAKDYKYRASIRIST